MNAGSQGGAPPLSEDELEAFGLYSNRPEYLPLVDDEPSAFLYEIGGRVVRGRRLVGRFRVYYANLDAAAEAGWGAREVLDTYEHTDEFSRYVLSRSGSLYSRRLQQLLGDHVLPGNLLILDRLEIRPPYRGRRLGLVVLLRLIERFGIGTQLIALKVFPLQFEYGALKSSDAWKGSLQLATLPHDQRAATAALQRYYSRLGFTTLHRTEFMFRASDARLPELDELLRD